MRRDVVPPGAELGWGCAGGYSCREVPAAICSPCSVHVHANAMHLETCASCSRGWEKRCRRDRRLWGACSPDQHPLLAASGRHVQTHELGGRTSFELALAIMWL